MLSSVLRSPTAIKVNRGIMRAFVAIRQALNVMSLPAKLSELEKNIENLRTEVNDILADQNDINRRQTESNQVHLNCRGAKEEDGVSESTRAQLDAISTALAELQAKEPRKREHRPIGFIVPEDKGSLTPPPCTTLTTTATTPSDSA